MIFDLALAEALDALPGKDILKFARQISERVRREGEALLHGLAPHLERVGEIAQLDRRPRLEEQEEVTHLFPEPLIVFCRKENQTGARWLRLAALAGGGAVVLLDDHVGVRPPGPKRGESRGSQDCLAINHGPLPMAQLTVQHKGGRGEIDVWIRDLRVQRRYELPVLHLEQYLGESRDAGGGFAMPDVRLGRPQPTTLALVRVGTERLGQARDFDRITQAGAGPMRLDVADPARFDARLLHGLGDHLGLGVGIGYAVAAAPAAVVDGAALDDAVDEIAIPFGVGQSFQDGHAHAFAGSVTIGPGAEALATALCRKELAAAEQQVLVGMKTEVDPAGKREIGVAMSEVLTCQVQAGEGARAHGVHRHAGPVQVQHVGNAVGDTGVTAAQGQSLGRPARAAAEQLEFAVTHQIRVHLSSMGNPVIGDQIYSKKWTKYKVPYILLASTFLKFKHPLTGEELSFRVEMPAHMKEYIEKLDTMVSQYQ